MLYGKVLTPVAVYAKFLAIEHALRQSILASACWIRPTELVDPRRADTFMGIGRGEAEVLVLAQERDARLVIIDGRRAPILLTALTCQRKAGISDEQLADLVIELRAEDRLCIVRDGSGADGGVADGVQIVCSLGLV